MIQITYVNSDNKTLCFKHAVKAIMEKDENVTTEIHEDNDPGESGMWYISSCVECFPEEDEG